MSKLERAVKAVNAFLERIRQGFIRFTGFDITPDLDAPFTILPYVQWVVWSLSWIFAFLVLVLPIGVLLGAIIPNPPKFVELIFSALLISLLIPAFKFARWVILTFLPPKKKPES